MMTERLTGTNLLQRDRTPKNKIIHISPSKFNIFNIELVCPQGDKHGFYQTNLQNTKSWHRGAAKKNSRGSAKFG